MVKKFWTTVWTEVEVSNTGDFRVNMKDLLEQAGRAHSVDFPIKKAENPIKVKVNIKQYRGTHNNADKKKKVICLDTNQVFESLTAASKYYELSVSMLCNCLKGRTDTAGGYGWAYYTEQQQGG